VAYVRKSRSRGKEYRQIVESYREDGKVKQRVLVHMPRFAETPEHAVSLCEGYAKTERILEEKYSKRADEARARLQRVQETREVHDLPPSPQFAHPGAEEVSHRREAERYARQAEKYEEKAGRIRELLASGKIAPDSEEVREKLRQRREEAQARLRELEQTVRSN
jgi:hypothetical protein